ncbi:hypothetical protein EYF80_056263 [Liparis tanakae]|uniref:Uncharacterized protein n=1 Tax=Liparis tanakae TaxID=230148 RepID=A0A4Z2EXN6_9TELE|nr:hypothetical protein EYF80_056263 [Liparis tanakae]
MQEGKEFKCCGVRGYCSSSDLRYFFASPIRRDFPPQENNKTKASVLPHGGSVRLQHAVHLGQFLEARPPVVEVVVLVVRVGRPRLQRAERLGHRALALVGVRLQRVVRRGAGVRVRVQQLRQHVAAHAAVAAARDARLGHVPRQALDLRQHVLPRRARGVEGVVRVVRVEGVAVRLARVPHGADVEGLGVLLAAALVVVAHDVLVDVLLLVAQEGFLAVGAQGEHEQDHHWAEGERSKVTSGQVGLS